MGLVALCFVLYELLLVLGVFSYLGECWVSFIAAVQSVKETLAESSEAFRDWVGYFNEWLDWAQLLMPLQRWLALLVALALIFAWALHEALGGEDQDSSSVATASSLSAGTEAAPLAPPKTYVEPDSEPASSS